MSTKTKTVGYFNPNDYPMQVVVSEHNLTLNLPAKSYVIDRRGRMVTDPILDNYVGKGRLARATGKTEKDIVFLAPVNRQPLPGQPAPNYQHAVSSAAGFQRDSNGQMQPIAHPITSPQAQSQAPLPPPVSYNPVKALSIEEAKRLRLIRPTRHVPEDFGVSDTAGAPVQGESVPYIQHARDTSKALVERLPEVVAKEIVPQAQGVVTSMSEAAEAGDIDDAEDVVALAMKEAKANPNQPLPVQPPPPKSSDEVLNQFKEFEQKHPVQPLEEVMKTLQPVRQTTVAPPIPANPQPTPMSVNPIPASLPEPNLDDPITVEEELTPSASTVREPDPDDTIISPPHPTAEEVKCPKCPEVQFSNPGYLKRHINRKHADEAVEMLAELGLS